MNLILKKIFILIFFFSIYSCEKKQKNNNSIIRNSDTVIDFSFDFPDTVYINEPVNGKIKFKGKLDTLTTKMAEQNTFCFRYVTYNLFKTDKIDHQLDLKQLSKKVTDTMIALDNTEIYLVNLKFENLGTQFLDGIIVDEALITIEQPEKKVHKDSFYRHIIHEKRAFHKVVVIERKD